MSNVASIDEKRTQREQDAKERALNAPTKTNRGVLLLENENDFQQLDLMKHLECSHILKRMALSMEKTSFVAFPSSTAFLIMLSVFSGYSSRVYRISRDSSDYNYIPLGLYVVAEQPSGSAKDFPLNLMNRAFKSAKRSFEKATKERAKDLSISIDKAVTANKDDPNIKALCAEEKQVKAVLSAIAKYTTSLSDTTPEGLEVSLIDTNGYFTVASAEQSVLNVLIGGMYSNGDSNNEVLLKGFDGGDVDTYRAGRGSFTGMAAGSFTVFAQKGSLKTLYGKSGMSGLHERTFKIAEPNRMGKRDFINGNDFNWHLMDELKEHIEPLFSSMFTTENMLEPAPLYELPLLKLTGNGYYQIKLFQQEMEDLMDDGGIYHGTKMDMGGTLAKTSIQVIKMAGCLHLLDSGFYEPIVQDKYVTASINIIRDITLSYHRLMERESLTGEKAAYLKIMDYLSKSPNGKPIRAIQAALQGVKPFTMPKPYPYIRTIIEQMIEHDILKVVINRDGVSVVVVS